MIARRLLNTASYVPEMATFPTSVILSRDDFSPPQRIVWAAHRRHALPSVWMRAGTSKGLFIHRHHLPLSESDWAPILLSAMGSRDGDKRQLDGIGGATSTTSKVAVISKSKRPGVDVDYTFIQVAPNEACVDMSGNCGNIASGVGPFALDEGLIEANPGQADASRLPVLGYR
jgi:2-methylaconitate cis-trans-isomerase PrpF